MKRRAKFSWTTHWREKYATGEIDLAQFETLIGAAIRAEREPRAATRHWSDAASAKVANYSLGIRSDSPTLAREDARIHTATCRERS